MEKQSTFDISKAKGNSVMLAAEFIKQSEPIIVSNEELYIWNRKFYERITQTLAHKLIMKFFQTNNILPAWKHAKAEEMIKAIKYFPTIKDIEKMDDYDNLMNLDNVIVNLDTQEALPHSSDYYFSYAISVEYNIAEQDHPNFSKFLTELFMTPSGPDIDTIRLIIFIMAYLIYPQIKIPKMFVFLGIGANGKSVLIEIIKMFFPKKYVTSISLGIISSSESFARNSLAYSKLNITTEEKVGKKIESEEIKKVVSGEQIPIRKLYNEPIEIYPATKLLLSTNDFFYLNDNSDGAFRRLCIIEFKNKFMNKDDYDAEIDPKARSIYLSHMEEEILSGIAKEKSAIFNTLLSYIASLKKNCWQLPQTKNSKEILAEYKAGADTLGTWLVDNYKIADFSPSEPRAISLNELLDEFKLYYEINFPGKRFGYSVNALSKKIKQLFRVDGERRNREFNNINGKKTTRRVMVYNLEKKEIDESLPTDSVISIEPAQSSYQGQLIDDGDVDF